MGTEWSEPEEERVARWLRDKIRRDEDEPEVDDAGPGGREPAPATASPAAEPEIPTIPTPVPSHASSEAPDAWGISDAPDAPGGSDTSDASEAPWPAGDLDDDDRELREQLEAEVDRLDAQRRRLAAAFDEERAHAERVHREQMETRALLDAEVAQLDEQRRELTAAFEAERAAAEVPQEQLEARARLEAEVAQLEEQRQRLASAFEEERDAAERARREQLEARARLEAELVDLDQQRQRLHAAFEALRSAAERVPQHHAEQSEPEPVAPQHVERSQPPHHPAGGADPDGRRQAAFAAFQAEASPAERAPETVAGVDAEVIHLDEQRRRLGVALDGERSEAERLHHDQEEARAKLAASLSELGRHLAAASEAAPDERGADQAASERSARPTAQAADVVPPLRFPAVALDRRRASRGVVVKAVLVLALVTLVAVEAASPVLTREELDDVARQAAHRAAVELVDHQDLDRARGVAQTVAEKNHAALESFSVDHRGVRVVVERDAPSFLLQHWDVTAPWYEVEATATAANG